MYSRKWRGSVARAMMRSRVGHGSPLLLTRRKPALAAALARAEARRQAASSVSRDSASSTRGSKAGRTVGESGLLEPTLLGSRPRAAFHRGRALPRSFYERDTEIVAREMLGTVLECETPDGTASGIVVETEAYLGEHDLACHAAAGRTTRTEALYGPPGISYVYFIYGMYWCFNAVTREEGLPSAVLVRALEPLDGISLMHRRRPRVKKPADLTNGPGKLCTALGIDGSMSSKSLQRKPLVIREGELIPDDRVE